MRKKRSNGNAFRASIPIWDRENGYNEIVQLIEKKKLADTHIHIVNGDGNDQFALTHNRNTNRKWK